MVNVSSILTVTSNIKLLTMQYILTCPNGKQIDMSSIILMQLHGDITREDVLNKINYYKSTNK
jgi:hypothetical protein